MIEALFPALLPLPLLITSLQAPGSEGAGRLGTLRLADHLDEARIESPLVGLRPAADVSELADPALDLLVEESFEDFDWEFAGWTPVRWASIAEENGGHVLRLEGVSREVPMGWILPVRSDAFYRFERSVRVEGVPFCDIYVVESRRDIEEARLDTRSHFLAGRGEALKVHGLPLESGKEWDNTWQRGSTSFYPTPRTRSLTVLIRPRVGADPAAIVQSISFDDIVLEEVVPSRKERMRLLMGADAAEGASPERGMRKAGWLLPLPSPGGVQQGEPAETNYDWRRALYAPPTTEIIFEVDVPQGARLRFATGLARETPPKASARFQVEVQGPGDEAPTQLHDEVRAANMPEWSWSEADIDLSAWSGKRVSLTLRTLAEKSDPHPLWANPRIERGADEDDPLVILIAVDTLRADRLSAYGYERPTSPALERLAAEGVLFDQARANCNWTCPSFASIFTGLVPSRHGVTSYGPATPLPDELVTLAEHFQERGWATRSIAYKVPLFDGNYEQGFDQAFNVPRDVIRAEENLARAMEWLEAHRGGPTFLFLHFNDPHQPFVQPEPFDRAFGPGPDEVGVQLPIGVPNGQREEERRFFSDLYDGSIAYTDECIGRFLDSLRERGLYDKATIAFVADHGEQFWEHGRFGHGGEDLYDEIVRVPLIVKPPTNTEHTFEAGSVVTADVSGFDVMPTLLEFAGVPPATKLDARSLVPLIRGLQDKLDRVVVTETSRRGLALVDGGFKYVLRAGGGPESLYHLASDPLERSDVIADHPEELARLRKLAIAYILEHRPGNYLLVHADDEPARLRVASETLRTLIGPSTAVDSRADPPQSSSELPAQTWALFEIEGLNADEAVAVGLPPRGASTGFGPWVAGGLPHLSGAGIWRLRGPDPPTHADTSNEPVDLEVMEALERLGYAE